MKELVLKSGSDTHDSMGSHKLFAYHNRMKQMFAMPIPEELDPMEVAAVRQAAMSAYERTLYARSNRTQISDDAEGLLN